MTSPLPAGASPAAVSPSVAALRTQFGAAIARHQVSCGDTIVYVDRRHWFTRISADGGTGSAKVYTRPANADIATLSPLPGSRGFLFTYCNGNCAVQSDLYVYDLAQDSARVVVPQAAGGWYSPTGHLLYTGRDGGLYAVAFDLKRLLTRSGTIPVIDRGTGEGQVHGPVARLSEGHPGDPDGDRPGCRRRRECR